MNKVQIELPPKLIPLFSQPNLRYRSSWGGAKAQVKQEVLRLCLRYVAICMPKQAQAA